MSFWTQCSIVPMVHRNQIICHSNADPGPGGRSFLTRQEKQKLWVCAKLCATLMLTLGLTLTFNPNPNPNHRYTSLNMPTISAYPALSEKTYCHQYGANISTSMHKLGNWLTAAAYNQLTNARIIPQLLKPHATLYYITAITCYSKYCCLSKLHSKAQYHHSQL